MNIRHYVLSEEDISQLRSVVRDVFGDHGRTDLAALLFTSQILAQRLPFVLREMLYQFKLAESADAVCIHGNPISEQLGPTPQRLRTPEEARLASPEEVVLLLYAGLLGEPFTWSSIQSGNLVNDVIPILDNADKPMSSGSTNVFDLHTEDAFHEWRGDYLGLLCLRNPSATPTILSSISDVHLSNAARDMLFEPRFRVGSNAAHEVDQTVVRSSILYGDQEKPYLRINVNVDPLLGADQQALNAYQELTDKLQEAAIHFALMPGDCLLIDNYTVAHGRTPYAPDYDGQDRWLKRVYITCDLRKSRARRGSAAERVISVA